MPDSLTRERIATLRVALAAAPFDAFLAVSTANVLYATGYRSMGATVFDHPTTTGAFVTGDRTVVAAPVADSDRRPTPPSPSTTSFRTDGSTLNRGPSCRAIRN